MKRLNGLILAFCAVLFLASCTTEVIKYKYIEVEIPVVPDIPEPKKFKKPVYPIDNLRLTDKKDYPKIGKAYVTSIDMCRGEIEKRDQALNVYRKKDGTN